MASSQGLNVAEAIRNATQALNAANAQLDKIASDVEKAVIGQETTLLHLTAVQVAIQSTQAIALLAIAQSLHRMETNDTTRLGTE